VKFHFATSQAKRAFVVTALYLLGIACFQVAWLLGVMPFGQMDEIDHAYRAASVAHGHLTDRSESTSVRGDVIRVPADLVKAAHQPCLGYKYLKSGNCSALSSANTQGDVLVGSAAARYNPFYYAVVGVPAVTLFPHSGTGMLYAMRVITVLWADILLALAVYLTVRVARSAWPIAGLMVATVPVLLCATTAAAPNGIQMAGGLLMWCALGGLIGGRHLSRRTRGRLLALATLGAAHVLLTHSTGPLWFALSVVAAALALGWRGTRNLVSLNPKAWARATAILAVIGAGASAWIVLEKPNMPSGDANAHLGGPPLSMFFEQPMVWVAQCIGAVPFREQFAPLPVLAIGMAAFGVLLVIAYRRAPSRVRRALAFIALATIAVSLALNASTYSQLGNAWQGRYTLAFSYGLPVLAGWSLNRACAVDRTALMAERLLIAGIGLAVALVNVSTIVTMFVTYERPRWTVHATPSAPPLAALVVPAVAGGLLLVAAAALAALANTTRQHADLAPEIGTPATSLT
jgi:hypothetical protein